MKFRSSRRVWTSLVIFALSLLVLRKWWNKMEPMARLEFEITKTWDNQPIDHNSIQLSLFPTENGLGVEIDAPFFNDPPNPGGQPGSSLQGLWDYEVVEVFFLNKKKQYLEAEFCPHGQHLVLLLSDYRKPFKDMLNLTYSASISGNSWTGKAIIPWEYFPQNVVKFNAYAIHGSGNAKVYESLYPVPHGKFSNPDFHRLDYFQRVNFDTVISWPTDASPASEFWKNM